MGDGAHTAFIHLSNADSTTMSARVSDNIVSGTSQPLLVEDGAHATVTGKNNWLQTGAASSGLTGTVFGATPGFANAASDDFTLASGSPCIGAADTSVGGLPTDEYYQNETVTRMYRVRASALDIGAFEHTTAGRGIGPYGATALDAGDSAAGAGSTDSDAGPGDGTSPGEADGGVASGDASSSGGSSSESGSGGCGCRTASSAQTFGDFSAWTVAMAAVIACARRRRGRRSTGGDDRTPRT